MAEESKNTATQRGRRKHKKYAWRLDPHRGVYDDWNDIQRLQVKTKHSYGNFKKFEGYDAKQVQQDADAFAKSQPITPKFLLDFWTKFLVVFIIVPTALFIVHYVAFQVYARYCQGFNAIGSPVCQSASAVTSKSTEIWQTIWSTLTVAFLTGIMKLCNGAMNTLSQ